MILHRRVMHWHERGNTHTHTHTQNESSMSFFNCNRTPSVRKYQDSNGRTKRDKRAGTQYPAALHGGVTRPKSQPGTGVAYIINTYTNLLSLSPSQTPDRQEHITAATEEEEMTTVGKWRTRHQREKTKTGKSYDDEQMQTKEQTGK